MAYFLAEKYAKKVLGEKEIESVLDRLDRLTLEESKTTAAQTLDVVCRLVNKMQVVMEGAHRQYVWIYADPKHQLRRWQVIDGRYPTHSWCVSLTCISNVTF